MAKVLKLKYLLKLMKLQNCTKHKEMLLQITLMISLKSQMMIMILLILNCIIKIFFYGFHKLTLIKMLT
ncbi:190R [Invertebrate iridescent virus 6]|uniref:190R n=1 Tax=Invertebrate iridescent virus 6 TaxID=176652 RepID=Q91FX6_IIV6|nr:190R [Invertebrate iridescent virus 6]AAK82056.1 190R [Invertebrate iridescent virus 6]